MGYDGQIVRVEKLQNGYEVEVCDPDIVKANNKPKSAYMDPWKGYAFTTAKEVTDFLTKVMDTLEPDNGDDMGTNFQRAIEDDDS